MEIQSLIELYQWALLKESATNLVTAKNASNLLLALYVMSYIINRKSCFIAAFFIVEFVGVLGYTSLHHRYLAYALIYSLMYWYLFFNRYTLKIMSGYVIMLLFQAAMAADAYLYYKTETVLYILYEYIIVAIHIYIISTIVDRKALTRIVGDSFRKLFNMLDIGYSLSFCYYSFKFNQ